MTSRPFWVTAAAVQGEAHRSLGRPCEDYFEVALRAGWLFAVVSDGAGSASQARIGARTLATVAVQALQDSAEQISLGDEAGFQSLVEGAILTARKTCVDSGPSPELNNYLATCVGVALHSDGGYFFHIGDGLAEAFTTTEQETASLQVSRPENGIYSNITYFFAMDTWREHLRIIRFGPTDAVLLMTDGVTSFAAPAGAAVRPAFARDLIEGLFGDTPHDENALAQTLLHPKARRYSQDDKTLLAIRVRR
ncbi:PP2C family serine/threonine-protein phosphatase [Aquabacter spiritensis]|uniref:PP2C family serine/threonine-protein phosphatase n=1 Tax=Aquabacter spiritensis TaxID=933073 RepID=UPI001A9DCCD2|nr:PP2C family serine/threonine-protein phosphatase [Aquabacter spiritensis]